MKYKVKISLLMLTFVMLLSFSCVKKNTVDNKTITHTIIERRKQLDTINKDLFSNSITPFYYNNQYVEYLNNCQEFDDFIKKIDRQNEYEFMIPKLFNDEMFSKTDIQFKFISDYDTIYTNCLKKGEYFDESRKQIKDINMTLEEADYKLVTDYSRIQFSSYYNKENDEDNLFKFDFDVNYYTRTGKLVIDYYNKIYNYSNIKFDIYDFDNFEYYETRDYLLDINNKLKNVKSRIIIYDNSFFNAYLDIIIHIDQETLDEININEEIDEEKLSELTQEINKIYDYIYKELIECGYNLYLNKKE